MASDILEKISKLLAQAEGTTNQVEAEAYTERAQHLAATYSINLELARHRQKSKEQREELTKRRIQVGEPDRQFKNRWWVDLFLEIAATNDLRITISHDRAAVWAYGYPSDTDVAEMLFASLNTQMVSLCGANLKAGVHKAEGIHGATYRLNFYEGFIQSIGHRLYKARADAMREQKLLDAEAAELFTPVMEDGSVPEQVTATDSGEAEVVTGALVMVKKKEAVNDYYTKSTAGTLSGRGYRSIRPKTVNYTANAHGTKAGQSARIGAQGALSGGRRALG